jgi:hypothetical protein
MQSKFLSIPIIVSQSIILQETDPSLFTYAHIPESALKSEQQYSNITPDDEIGRQFPYISTAAD